jgi:hypothetical protein
MLKRIAIILLLGCSWAIAVPKNIYVDPARADNSGDGLTWAAAKRTLGTGADRAYDAAADGDTIIVKDGTFTRDAYLRFDKALTLTITSETPGGATISTSDPTRCVKFETNATDNTKVVTFSDINLTTAAGTGIYMDATHTAQIVLENVSLDSGTGNCLGMTGMAGVAHSFSATGCTFTSSNNTPFAIDAGALLYLDDCTFTIGGAGNNYIFDLDNAWTRIDIRGCTFTVNKSIFWPQGMTSVSTVRFTDNTITTTPDWVSQYAFRLPNIPVGDVTVQGNTITQTGDIEYRPIWIGDYGDWDANEIRGPIIRNNTISTVKTGSDGTYAMRVGPNVRGAIIEGNTITGGYFGIAAQCRGATITRNKVRCQNPLVMFGLSQAVIDHNTSISVGATDSRALVMGRNAWFGGGLDAGDTNTTFGGIAGARTVTLGGAASLVNADAALDAGFPILAYAWTGVAELGTVHYGTVTAIDSGAPRSVTLGDWYDYPGRTVSDPPADGTKFWLVTFGRRVEVTNNILDGSAAVDCINFDFNPTSSEFLYDYNLYRAGTSSLSNLGRDESSTIDLITTLTALRTAWGTYQTIQTDNDANSQVIDPLLLNTSTTFRVSLVSPAIGAASDGMTIGAWQPVPVRRPQRITY